MRNERNDSSKDRDQLQETAEFNQISYDFLQKGRWNVEKFKEKTPKTLKVTWALSWSLLLRTLPQSDPWKHHLRTQQKFKNPKSCVGIYYEERANVQPKDLPERWMLFVILSPQEKGAQKWKKNAKNHNEDIKTLRTSILGTIKWSWTEENRTRQKFIKVTACWRILTESNAQYFFQQEKM